MKKKLGFTLLELIITVALVSIVTAIAVPSMKTYGQNNRLTTNINVMIGHLAYARSEAVKRSQQVSICVSNDAATCTGGNNWEDGWIIYIDADGSNTFDASEEVLRAQQALDTSQTLTPTTFVSQVTYDYRGFATSTGSFQLCDNRTGPHGKTISISNTGRVRFQDGSAC